jgi:hypothetical protein
MVFRLDLASQKDRELLERSGVDLKALLGENARSAKLALEKLPKDVPAPSKTLKYRNKQVEHKGMKFDSQFELSCWLILEDLEKQSKIQNLKRQQTITFKHNDVKLMSSRPDFYFEVKIDDKVIPIYADAKNKVTAKLRPFRITQNMFKAFYGTPMIVFLTYTSIETEISSHLQKYF